MPECEVFIIQDFHHDREYDELPSILLEAKHGDIICGTDYDMQSTCIVYKHNDETKIISALDLSECPKTVFNIPIKISEHIHDPNTFYYELLDEEESLNFQETFICEVKLTNVHEWFVKQYFKDCNFEIYKYTLAHDILYQTFKDGRWGIESRNLT
jgi:hypothetical protein